MEDKVVKGIILYADFGYGLKFKDSEELFLKLEIQGFDGYFTTQLFNMENTLILLKMFKSDYSPVNSIHSLKHRKVCLLKKSNSSNPVAISVSKHPYEWVYNNNYD